MSESRSGPALAWHSAWPDLQVKRVLRVECMTGKTCSADDLPIAGTRSAQILRSVWLGRGRLSSRHPSSARLRHRGALSHARQDDRRSRDYRLGHAHAYDAAAPLEPLFVEFIEDSAAVINARTEFKYRADFARFSDWLTLVGIPATLAALERRVLNKYVAWLKSRPAPTGRSGKLSNHTIDSLHPHAAHLRALWSATAASRAIPSTDRVRHGRTSASASSAPQPRAMSQSCRRALPAPGRSACATAPCC